MCNLTVFSNSDFGTVRTLEEDGAVLFCAVDVANALGYARPQNAIATHCRYSLKRGAPHPQAPDKLIEMTFIPESDLYRLVFSSKLPTAEKFTDWVTKEVLPSIRKNQQYTLRRTESGNSEPLRPLQLMQDLMKAKDEIALLSAELAAYKMKELQQENEMLRQLVAGYEKQLPSQEVIEHRRELNKERQRRYREKHREAQK